MICLALRVEVLFTLPVAHATIIAAQVTRRFLLRHPTPIVSLTTLMKVPPIEAIQNVELFQNVWMVWGNHASGDAPLQAVVVNDQMT